MKKFLTAFVVLTFATVAYGEGLEIQINPIGGVGTSGSLTINDKDTGDNTPWGFSGEVYKSIGGEELQIGGTLAIEDPDTAGSDTMLTLGALARYNLAAGDLRNSIFVGGGMLYTDSGDFDSVSLTGNLGKRFALSDHITYTPNVSLNLRVAGDYDKGISLAFNFLSFSGFL